MIPAGMAVAPERASPSVVRRDRALVTVAVVTALAAVLLEPVARDGVLPAPTVRLLAIAFAATSGLAIVLALLDRGRRDPAREPALRLLAVAGAVLWGGQVLGYAFTVAESGVFDPRAEVVPLLAALPFAAVALARLCWPVGMTRLDRRTAILDSVISVSALVVIWTQVVTPRWVYPDSGQDPLWERLDQVLMLAAFAVIAVVAVLNRRVGSLPFPQLALLVGAPFVYFCSDLAGQLVDGADNLTLVTYSLPGYAIAAAMLVAFAHRPAVELESARMRRGREFLAALTPAVLALVAGTIVISLAATELMPSAVAGSVLAWSVMLVAVLVARLSMALDLRRAQESALVAVLADRTREGWFRALVGDSTEGVLVLDDAADVVYASPQVEREYRFVGDAERRSFSDLLVEVSADELRLVLAQVSLDPARTSGPYDLLLHAAGERAVEVEVMLRPVTDIDFQGYVVTMRDVSDTRRLERQLANSRRRDELTGLLSREAFLADLSAELDTTEGRAAVVVLDLERFGDLNDGLGHETGDEILVAVARTFERLPEEVRAAARIGADSFAWLVVADDLGQAVAEAVEQSRDDVRGLILSGGREIEVAFRAGYVVSDPMTSRSAEWHVEAADLAMARAKSSRHALLVEYRSEMRAETERRLRSERMLRRAISEGRVDVFYQPVLRLSDGVALGAEALARMWTPSGDLVQPADFIPLAEELGLIRELGLSVLRRACRQTVEASERTGRGIHVAVNVAVDQLVPGFVAEVTAVLAESGLPASDLTLEITESTLADHGSGVAAVLRGLRALGVSVSLDDFGTGFSSMSYLATLPVDGLKIDRAFVSVLGTSGEGLTLARVVVQLAASLDLSTVAEGIETIEQCDLLRGMGCTYGQGFLFARPMPFEAYVDYLSDPLALTSSLAP